ncbi:MAG: hypothetical protein AB7L84_15405 [Acidimicrobiia bacterium]
MGKASSSKKVARAARAGSGRVRAGQSRSLLFPGVLAAVVVLGLGLIFYAREDRRSEDIGGIPQIGDHIHLAFGVNVCGEWKPDIPEFESPVGIHTHGDGVIHVHPFSQLGVGVNATLGRFFADGRDGQPAVDLKISDDELTYLGEKIEEGETTCEGVEDPQLRIGFWPNASDPSADPIPRTGDYADLRLQDDGGAVTIFYGDPDADIPLPPTAANLAVLGAVDGPSTLEDPESAQTTTTVAAEGESTTATPGDEEDDTTTTTAGDGTTTTSTP